MKKNNFVSKQKDLLTDRFHVENYMPKIEKILQDNKAFLNDIRYANKDEAGVIQISSYNPINNEVNITPIIASLLRSSNLPLVHSLPVVDALDEPLIFRVYQWGDDQIKSKFFDVLEPTSDKRRVYPQVIITPIMGFMGDCHRIGYGGGFYDRSIAQLREHYDNKILLIGVAYQAQKFDQFTGKLAEADVWSENQNTKIAKMRSKFAKNSGIQWVQLETDEPLDYIVTE